MFSFLSKFQCHCVHPWMCLTLVLVLFFSQWNTHFKTVKPHQQAMSSRGIVIITCERFWCFTVRLCFIQLVKFDSVNNVKSHLTRVVFCCKIGFLANSYVHKCLYLSQHATVRKLSNSSHSVGTSCAQISLCFFSAQLWFSRCRLFLFYSLDHDVTTPHKHGSHFHSSWHAGETLQVNRVRRYEISRDQFLYYKFSKMLCLNMQTLIYLIKLLFTFAEQKSNLK